jgi:hypothetical protein
MEQHSNVPDVKLHEQAAASLRSNTLTQTQYHIPETKYHSITHIDPQRQYERMYSSAVLKFPP